jgi:glutamate racemase
VLGSSGRRDFLTTAAPGRQNGLVASFWGAEVMFLAA